MNLIKELLSLKEAEDDAGKDDLTKMKQSAEKNLKAVDLILRADGDIPIDRDSNNQCDKLGAEGGSQVFYVSINPPHGDVEAYVVVDKAGKFSYYDFNDELVVIDGKFASRDQVTREWANELEDIINEFKFESGNVADGGIKAFMDHLHKSKDSDFDSRDDEDDQY